MLLRAEWDGDALKPTARFRDAANRFFVVGLVYTVDADEPHSDAGRRAFFAELRSLWNNLPENLDSDYPTPEHLRKRALIKCGYYTSNSVVLKTDDEARVVAGIMKPLDEFSVVVVRGNVVTVYRAKSTKQRNVDGHGMTKEEWDQAKKDVLAMLHALVGVAASEARKNLDFG